MHVIVSGHGRIPRDSPLSRLYETLVVCAVVDVGSGRILRVGSNLATDAARDFLADMLTGLSIDCDGDKATELIAGQYWGAAKRALAAAVSDLFRKWAEVAGTVRQGIEYDG